MSAARVPFRGMKDRILSIALLALLTTSALAVLVPFTERARAEADVVVNIAVDKPEVYPQEYMNYTIQISNIGDMNASSVLVNDTMPSSVQHMFNTSSSIPSYNSSWVIGYSYYFQFIDVPPGSYYFTINVSVNPGLSEGTPIRNDVYASYTNSGGNPATDPPPMFAQSVVILPDITVEKSVDKVQTAIGDLLTYAIYFNNTGSGSAANVLINDVLPSFTVYDSYGSLPPQCSFMYYSHPNVFFNCTKGLLLPNSDYHLTLSAVVNPGIADLYLLENTVTVTYETPVGQTMLPTSDGANTTARLPVFDLAMVAEKGSVMPDEAMNYTLYLNNTGSGIASKVWVNVSLDPLMVYLADSSSSIPGGQKTGSSNWTFSNLGPGSYSFDISVLGGSVAVSTWTTSTAAMEYTDSNGNLMGNGSALASVLIDSEPLIKVEFIVDKPQTTRNDILTYIVFFNNTGPGNALTVWINATFPPDISIIGWQFPPYQSSPNKAQWEFANVLPGQHSMWIKGLVSDTALNDVPLTAMMELNYTDMNLDDRPGSEATATTIISFPAFMVRLDTENNPTYRGGAVELDVTFPNFKNSIASTVWLNVTFWPDDLDYLDDTAPSVPYFHQRVVNQGSLRYEFRNVPFGLNHSFTISFGVNMSSSTTTWVNANLWFTDYFGNTFEPSPSHAKLLNIQWPTIDARLVPDRSEAMTGEMLGLKVYFNNTGNSAASEVAVNVTAERLEYVGDDSASVQGVGGVSGGPLSWTFSDVGVGTHSFNITARVKQGFVDGTILSVFLSVDYSYNGTVYPPETSSAQVTVRGLPAIGFQVNPVGSEFVPGIELAIDVDFDNLGNARASSVWINLSLPEGLTYMGDTSSGVAGVSSVERPAAGRWLFKGVQMGPHNFSLMLRPDAGLPDGFNLKALLAMDFTDDRGTDYQPIEATVDVVLQRPVLGVELKVSDDTPEPGQHLVFTIIINSTGSARAGQVIIELTGNSLVYISDTSGAIGAVRQSGFRYVLTDTGNRTYSFNITAVTGFELPESFINVTVFVLYTDTTGKAAWNASSGTGLVVSSMIPPAPPVEPFNFLPVLLMVLSTIGLSSILLSESSKYMFFLLFLPLYSKLKKRDILEHETRGLIRGYIIANPGDHFNSIKKALTLNNGTLAYHLHVLERERLVLSRRWGKFTRFYPSGMRIPENGSKYSEIQKMIIGKIRETPGITQKEISVVIGITKSTINYHMNKLTDAGVIEARRSGIKIRYFPAEDGHGPSV